MLNKRTNILFEHELWEQMTNLAKRQNISVGELVRQAVSAHHQLNKDTNIIKKLCSTIETERKKSKNKIDYKALINYGRK